MLRGWIQSKSANTSTHSLDTLAEPQNRTRTLVPISLLALLTYVSSGDGPSRYYSGSEIPISGHKADGMPCVAAAHIMNDDLESAEAGLTNGISSFHKVCQILLFGCLGFRLIGLWGCRMLADEEYFGTYSWQRVWWHS